MISALKSIVVAVAAAVCALPAQAQNQPPIRVGFLSSFTGPSVQSGFNGIVAMKLAAKEINDRGGVMGRQIEVVQGDDASEPTQGVNEARRLVQNQKVNFLLGPLSSQITLAIAPIVNEAKIGWISVSGSSAITPQVAPYHFSMLTSADAQAEFIGQYAERTLKARAVAIIHDAGAQSRATVDAWRKQLKNIKITGVESYELTATDVTAQLLSLRRGNPDTLLLSAGVGSDVGYVLKGMQEIGWNLRVAGNTTVVAQPGVVVKIAGPNAYKNVVGVNYLAQTYCSKDPVGSGDYTKFKDRLQAFDPANFPKYSPLVVAYIYDGFYAMKAMMEGAKSTEGPALAAWMEQNASKVKVTNGQLSASKTNHFLIGIPALTMAEDADKPRSDGMMKRAGC